MANSCIITGPKLNKQQAKKVGSLPVTQSARQAGNRQAGRKTGRKTGKQEDRKTGRQEDRKTGRQAGRQTGRPEQAGVDTYRRQETFQRLDDQSH